MSFILPVKAQNTEPQTLKAQDLAETYQLALENDPVLKQFYYSQFSVAESKSQSIAQMLPTISVSGQSSRSRIDSKKANFQSEGTQNYWDSSFSINFTQPVFHWDHWVELSQSDNLIAQSEAQYQAELQSLMVQTTEAYFNILAAQDNLEFTISEKKAIARQLEQATQRFDVGLIAITDVYEAKAAFDQSRAAQIEAENLVDNRKEDLRKIIGENDANLAILAEEISYSPPVPNDIAEWTNIADTNNLDVVAAINQAEVSRKNIQIQQSGHMPTLDVVANYGVADVNSSFGQRGDTQSVGLQLNIPLFQGGIVNSRSRQAGFDYQVSKENLIDTKREVTRLLKNSFRNVISTMNRAEALKAAVTSAISSLEATEAGFDVGTRTMVDVLAEQRNLYQAKRDHSKSRYDYLVSGVQLKQAASSLTEQDLSLINQFLVKLN